MSGAAPDLTIRRARMDECAALTDLSMRSKQSNGYDDDFMDACREELTVRPTSVEDGDFWVAERGALVGCVRLSRGGEPDLGEIDAFFVAPEWRRRGVGRLLWAKVLDRSAALGFARLGLDADPFAEPYYRTLGFVTVGGSPSGSIPDRVIPRMKLALTPQGARRSV